MLAAAKREGLPVSVETCPHYLHCVAEDIPDGATLFKCAPPIRSGANREGLWQGLRAGTIDLIATDHSPCPPEMKRLEEGRFDRAWGGIASLSTALPVLWTECAQRGFSLAQLVRWTSTAPAWLASIDDRVGTIQPGKLANLVAFDPEARFTLTPERLHYRHAVSPYMGETLQGEVQATWLRGRPVFRAGEFAKAPHGREMAVATSPVLRDWNRLGPEEAVAQILPANGSRVWAEAMAQARGLYTPEALFRTADEVWRSLSANEWQGAFDSHPRLGESHAKAATAQSLAWSSGEQRTLDPDEALRTALAEGNRAYEARFGRVFLLCATGKGTAEILALLERQLGNDPGAELLEAAEQQRRITQLRLRKWLGLPVPRSEAV